LLRVVPLEAAPYDRAGGWRTWRSIALPVETNILSYSRRICLAVTLAIPHTSLERIDLLSRVTFDWVYVNICQSKPGTPAARSRLSSYVIQNPVYIPLAHHPGWGVQC